MRSSARPCRGLMSGGRRPPRPYRVDRVHCLLIPSAVYQLAPPHRGLGRTGPGGRGAKFRALRSVDWLSVAMAPLRLAFAIVVLLCTSAYAQTYINSAAACGASCDGSQGALVALSPVARLAHTVTHTHRIRTSLTSSDALHGYAPHCSINTFVTEMRLTASTAAPFTSIPKPWNFGTYIIAAGTYIASNLTFASGQLSITCVFRVNFRQLTRL